MIQTIEEIALLSLGELARLYFYFLDDNQTLVREFTIFVSTIKILV